MVIAVIYMMAKSHLMQMKLANIVHHVGILSCLATVFALFLGGYLEEGI